MFRSTILGVCCLLAASSTLLLSGPRKGRPQDAQSVVNVCDAPTGLDDPQFARSQPYLFGWKLFLAMNCPAEKGSATPLVWETWKPVDAVYRPGGQKPDPWPVLSPRTLLDRPEIDSYTLLDRNQQPVLSEIRMNKATFDYIVQRNLYSKAGQLAFFNSSSQPINFPSQAMEVKAAWLILNPDNPGNSHYYTIRSSYVDSRTGQTHQVLAGLASLHISSKVLPRWFWTTFEHVDNQQRTQAPQVAPVPADVGKVNDMVHAALPKQSVWRFYNMRGVQLDYTTPNHTPTILANTLLETRFQSSSSCITCHDLATRGSADQGRLALWNQAGNGYQGHVGEVGDRSNRYADAYGKPVCYDSTQDAFTDCNPDKPSVVYKTLDFVWSLKEAK